MPRFAPFAGLRYDPARVEPAKVIAPPYDVVGPAERAALAARHSANAILVELPEPDPRTGRRPLRGRRRPAGRLAGRRASSSATRPGLLPLPDDRRPTARSTLGVLGELGIERRAAPSEVLPHEETLPKARSDRLELLAATRVNLSPIWGLSLAAGLTDLLDTDGAPRWPRPSTTTASATSCGWSTTRRRSARSTDLVGSAPVVVADGHHRLATAVDLPGGRRGRHARGRRDPRPGGRAGRRTRCRSGPSTACCPGCPTDSTWWTPSPRGSTWPGPATAPSAPPPRSGESSALALVMPVGLLAAHPAGRDPRGGRLGPRTPRWWPWCWPSCPTTS